MHQRAQGPGPWSAPLVHIASHHVCLRRAGKVHVVLRERNVMRCETDGYRLWSACVRYERRLRVVRTQTTVTCCTWV